MKLSVDFAFEGFRIIRQRPQVILFWGVVALLTYTLNLFILQAVAGTALQDMQVASQAKDTAAILAAFSKLAPAYAVLIPIGLISNAITACAVFRASSGNPGMFGGLRLGADEFRQIGVNILFFLIMLGLYIVVIIVGAVIAALLSAVAMMMSPAIGTVVMVIVIIGVVGVFLWFIARLSLAPAQSFAERRITMFDSWKLTKGNSLTLVIGYIIAGVMAILVALLCLGIFFAGLAILQGGDLMAVSRIMQSARDFGSILTNPAVLTYVVILNLIVLPLLTAIVVGAPAAAYRQLSGNKAGMANVF